MIRAIRQNAWALLGEWRSLVAHSAGGRAVAGSNPVSPIFETPPGKRPWFERAGLTPPSSVIGRLPRRVAFDHHPVGGSGGSRSPTVIREMPFSGRCIAQ